MLQRKGLDFSFNDHIMANSGRLSRLIKSQEIPWNKLFEAREL